MTERTYPTRTKKAERTIVVTWPQVLGETADAMVEEGLVGRYVGGGVRGIRSA